MYSTRGFICQYIMYNKHQNNMSVYYVQYSWIYISVYYVLVDLYVSILCTRGFTCTINIKTICQYIMYSTRGFICQYIMYSWFYMYNKHQNNMSVYYVQYSWIYMSVYYVLVDLHVQ